VLRQSTRLAAGTLVLALPLAAAAGCGVEKKRTIKAEFSSAVSNLENSKAVSFTLSFKDTKGTVAGLVNKDGSVAKPLVKELLGGSVTYTVDPASDKKLKELDYTAGTSSADLSAALKTVNLGFVVKDSTTALGELRLVDGVLYAHVDLKEIGRLAKAGGTKDFDSQLDDAVTSADPTFTQGLIDVRAGKWIQLPLTKYISKLQDLAKGVTGSKAPTKSSSLDIGGLTQRVFKAAKPDITVTDANDSSTNRVLDVNIKMRSALKAALLVLQAEKDLPFASDIAKVDPSDIDDNVSSGTAHGTVTLKSGHLTQVTVDIESIRTLNPDEKPSSKNSVAGASVVFDLDDRAGEVMAPTDVSTFDVGALFDKFFNGISGGVSGGSSQGFGYSQSSSGTVDGTLGG
jgi:hypothetical protein